MRHWWQLATRNWRARPGRTALATVAIALGVGVVVWVTGAYESIRQSVADQVWTWIGRSHISVESVYGQYGTVFESIVDDVQRIPNVAQATGRLKERMQALVGPAEKAESVPLDLVGIQPETEYAFRDYAATLLAGRVLRPGDAGLILIENSFADEYGLRIGDEVRVRRDELSAVRSFRVAGILQRRRVAKFQQPMAVVMLPELQAMAARPGPPRVTQVDIMLQDSSREALARTFAKIRAAVLAYQQGFVVATAEAKLRQVEAAQRQTQFILTLISGVALFTAFFIILSTLSMGMIERIAQLGLLRCVGLTRSQLFALVLAEVVPVGILGIALGVPVGIGLTGLSVLIVPEYIGHLAVSRWGLGLAVVGGAATALGGGILPAIQAMRVSPLEATRPQSRPSRPRADILAAILGAAMIIGHVAMVERIQPLRWITPPWSMWISLGGIMLIYCGYALLAPGLIRFGGTLFVRAAAALLAVRHRLLSDQVGRASWRSAGICSGLMVGLSLIVTLVVHTESLTAGWDFPKRMAEAFVWTNEPIRIETGRRAAAIGGVAKYALINDIRCNLGTFAAGDPDEFFAMARLTFVRGEQNEALAKLRRGGYILVTPQFLEVAKTDVGRRILVQAGRGAHMFEIAAAVESPALDIAAAYFNAESHLMAARVSGVMGTLADAKRYFGIDNEMTLFLINFDLPPTAPPPLFFRDALPPLPRPGNLVELMDGWETYLPERTAELAAIRRAWAELGTGAGRVRWNDLPEAARPLHAFRSALYSVRETWSKRSPSERWRVFREELVLGLIADRTGVPETKIIHKSVVELKAEIDRTLRTATNLMTAIPMVALVVAALGVGNLMMANVTSRARQLAVLRAVGATKSQVTRLVIGEAIVLGVIGSVLGLALGTHAARDVNALTHRIWGFPIEFAVPYAFVTGAIALTIGVCLIAGILPARQAARSNIVAAMQTP